MNNNHIKSSLQGLKTYVESQSFKGYDPYDTLNSYLPFYLGGRYGKALAIQFQKRNPVNIRPFIGIGKDYNPKGMALLLRAYSILYSIEKSQAILDQADFLANWLLEHYTKGYSGHCWGYNFDWTNPGKTVGKFHPTVVVSAYTGKGLYEYYLATGNSKIAEVLISISNFILRDLPVTASPNGICFSYSDIKKDCCYNASLLGAEILSIVYKITGEKLYLEKAISALDFVISHQQADGRWNYSIDIETGNEREQIDFHQGFVLESIYNTLKFTGVQDDHYMDSLSKGLKFYRNSQFYSNGQSLWRYPKPYPVDIHNQAQGIITFELFKEFGEENLPFAFSIAEWTIEHMQDKSGYFYYRKYRYHTNKISYMRWAQAWMMLALVSLLKN